jgi:hypothetical protein
VRSAAVRICYCRCNLCHCTFLSCSSYAGVREAQIWHSMSGSYLYWKESTRRKLNGERCTCQARHV